MCFVLQFWIRLINANHFWVLQLKFPHVFPFYICCLKKQSVVFPEAPLILTEDELTLPGDLKYWLSSLHEAGYVTSPVQNLMDCQCKVASQTAHNFTYCFIFLLFFYLLCLSDSVIWICICMYSYVKRFHCSCTEE